MAFTDVDKYNGFIIRKLHDPARTKTFGYLTLPDGYPEKDGTVMQHGTLQAARSHLGMPKAAEKTTLPKSAYDQNRKGYHAGGGSSKKG